MTNLCLFLEPFNFSFLLFCHYKHVITLYGHHHSHHGCRSCSISIGDGLKSSSFIILGVEISPLVMSDLVRGTSNTNVLCMV